MASTTLEVLPHAIDEAASRTPERDAVRHARASLSYALLADRSDRLAAVLVDEGVERGDRVGVYLNKGLYTAVAIHGIMKSGAAYVPLDPLAPAARLRFILQDCGIRHVVTETSKTRVLRRLYDEGAALECLIGAPADEDHSLRSIPWLDVDSYEAWLRGPRATADDLAYVLYTSGSTGVPKGVMHTHRSALSWAEVSARTYGLRADDRVSNHAPLHFDLSTLDFFSTAVAGATTVIIPEAHTKLPASLSLLMEQEHLTVLYVVPLVLVQLLLHGALEQRNLDALRWVLFGGEPMPTRHLRALMDRWPQVHFSNVYGPTETNGVTYYLVPPLPGQSEEPIPIGRPYERVETLVVDAHDQPVQEGKPGELLIHSPTMMAGYWGRPDLDEVAFSRRTREGGEVQTYHRTGDLVQRGAEGDFHFLGRLDRQIKTRGYRVELDEVEAILAAHELLESAAVFAVPVENGTRRIEAAVIPRAVMAAQSITSPQLKEYMMCHLPPYAVPERIAIVRDLPLTSTGKIDRRQLEQQAMSAWG